MPRVLTLSSNITQNSTTSMALGSAAGVQQQPPEIIVDHSSEMTDASQTSSLGAVTTPQVQYRSSTCKALCADPFSKITQNNATNMAPGSAAGTQEQSAVVPIDTTTHLSDRLQTLPLAAPVSSASITQVWCHLPKARCLI
jgi:hypothetical protein